MFQNTEDFLKSIKVCNWQMLVLAMTLFSREADSTSKQCILGDMNSNCNVTLTRYDLEVTEVEFLRGLMGQLYIKHPSSSSMIIKKTNKQTHAIYCLPLPQHYVINIITHDSLQRIIYLSFTFLNFVVVSIMKSCWCGI